MPRKCTVYACRSGYNSAQSTELKIKFYRFPKDDDDLQKWIKNLPNRFPSNFLPSNNQVVCSLHWPENFPTKPCPGTRDGVPAVPPTIFPNVPTSCIPTPSSTRPKKPKLSAQVRSTKPDELSKFKELDRLPACLSLAELSSKFPSVVVFEAPREDHFPSNFVILSKIYQGPYFLFKLVMTPAAVMRECYFKTELVTIPFLRKKQLHSWSQLEAILHYLENYERPLNFIEQEIAKRRRKYANVSGGELIYSNEDILFAFELISRSRSAYDFLSTYLKLPCTRLLRRFTAKIDSIEDSAFLKNIISSLEPKQRRCVVQIDEVYLRTEISYRGGEFYGFASNGKPAKTLLYFLLKFEFGGPILPFKYFPIATLTADDLMMYYTDTRHVIKESGGTVIAVITDNNRVNQRFLDKIPELFHEELPLNDSVHLTKCLRNNWLITGVIHFEDPDDSTQRQAKWCTLQNVYEEERGNLLKMSDLSSKSVFPKNIEKQSVH